jgi:hypothetical protein
MNASGRMATFETVILPLLHTRPTADRFLGSMTCIDQPIWLGTEPIVSQHVQKWDVVWPDGRPRPMPLPVDVPTPLIAELADGRIVRSDRRQFRVLDGGLAAAKR